MTTDPACPECGAPLPADAPLGLCPRCVLGQMIGGEPTAGHHAPLDSEKAVEKRLADLFPQLEILGPLGRGGMGVVYKARQIKLDRPVALKVIHPGSADDPRFAERFLREARALARLQHPNIVMVHDFGEVDGLFYLLMELVDGGDLRQALSNGPLGEEEALVAAFQLCDALQSAHEQGVVHRDIKPENILRCRDGTVKIADFGLAKLLAPSGFTPLTQTRQVMGTPHYMAPEQFEHPRGVDQRVDIYSLGVVLYEMFTGTLPLGRFELPSEKVGTEEGLDDIVTQALARDPDERYASVDDLRDDLIEFAGGYDLSESWSGAVVRAGLIEAVKSGGGGDSSEGWAWGFLVPILILFVWPLLGFFGNAPSWSHLKPDHLKVAILLALTGVGGAVVGWLARRSWSALWGASAAPGCTEKVEALSGPLMLLALVIGLPILSSDWGTTTRRVWELRTWSNSQLAILILGLAVALFGTILALRRRARLRREAIGEEVPMPPPIKSRERGKMTTTEAKVLGSVVAFFFLVGVLFLMVLGFLIYGVLEGEGWRGPLAGVLVLAIALTAVGILLAIVWSGIERSRLGRVDSTEKPLRDRDSAIAGVASDIDAGRHWDR